MSDLTELILIVAGASIGSVALGYAAIKVFRRKKPPVPKTNAILRIMTSGAIYRAYFVGDTPNGWAFTTPVQRDSFVPMHDGEPIVIETVMDGGVMIFQTYLKGRNGTPPLMIAAKPSSWYLDDRRETVRIADVGHLTTTLDGDRVGLLDMSACGARVRSQARRNPGDRVKLEIAGMGEIYAWVLAEERKGDRYIVRLRFEEIADLTSLAV